MIIPYAVFHGMPVISRDYRLDWPSFVGLEISSGGSMLTQVCSSPGGGCAHGARLRSLTIILAVWAQAARPEPGVFHSALVHGATVMGPPSSLLRS